MRSFEPFVILFVWYAPGFIAAHAMTRRGHDPMPWIFAAWVGGALCVIAALVWSRYEHRRDTHRPPPPQATVSSATSLHRRTP